MDRGPVLTESDPVMARSTATSRFQGPEIGGAKDSFRRQVLIRLARNLSLWLCFGVPYLGSLGARPVRTSWCLFGPSRAGQRHSKTHFFGGAKFPVIKGFLRASLGLVVVPSPCGSTRPVVPCWWSVLLAQSRGRGFVPLRQGAHLTKGPFQLFF